MPVVGETLGVDDEVFKAFGGKGANQAIAAAKLRSRGDDEEYEVQMLGQVGNDEEGRAFIKYLQENGVDYSGILTKEDACTGTAYILSLTESGDNSILIVGGSN
jgi:ribokinase